MKGFNKILVPVDFSSEASAVLVPYAKSLSQRLSSKIHLFHVQETLELLGELDLPLDYFKTFEREALETAKKRMERFVEEHFKDIDVKTDVLLGTAATEIVKFAEKENFDLILMGTHGRKGLDKILFGSVAYRVAKRATCPVLTVNPYRVKP